MLVDRVHRVLHHLEMVTGEWPTAPPVTEVTAFTWLSAPAEGLWCLALLAGDSGSDGQTIGEMRDLFRTHLANITTPHGGVALFVTSSPAMRKDGLVMAIGAP